MSTSNFCTYDENLIYVPKIFNEKHDDIVYEGYIKEILDEVYDTVDQKLGKLIRKYKNYIETGIFYNDYEVKIKVAVWNSDDEEEYDYNEGEIRFFFSFGYYWGGSMCYEWVKTEGNKIIEEIFYELSKEVEKIYKKYCDGYVEQYKFSNGETYYQKVK